MGESRGRAGWRRRRVATPALAASLINTTGDGDRPTHRTRQPARSILKLHQSACVIRAVALENFSIKAVAAVMN